MFGLCWRKRRVRKRISNCLEYIVFSSDSTPHEISEFILGTGWKLVIPESLSPYLIHPKSGKIICQGQVLVKDKHQGLYYFDPYIFWDEFL